MSKKYELPRYSMQGPASPLNGEDWADEERQFALEKLVVANKSEMHRLMKYIAACLNRFRGINKKGKDFKGSLVWRMLWGMFIGNVEATANWYGPRRIGRLTYAERLLIYNAVNSKSKEWGRYGVPTPERIAKLLHRRVDEIALIMNNVNKGKKPRFIGEC